MSGAEPYNGLAIRRASARRRLYLTRHCTDRDHPGWPDGARPCEPVVTMDPMPSQIAWLDASSEEQRRMRDIIQMFTDREARDELGIGTIRDALSDILS